MRLNYRSLSVALTWTIVVVMVFNFYTVYTIQKLLQERASASVEAAKPIVLETLLITNSKCSDCFDAKPLIEALEGLSRVQLKTKQVVDFSSPKAQEAITTWELKKFPSLVVMGDLAQAAHIKTAITELGGYEKEGAFLFPNPSPPYTDKEGKVHGLVSSTIIKDDSCIQCVDLAPLVSQLRILGIVVHDEKTVSSTSSEGKELLEKYNLKILPTILFSSDLKAYEQFVATWKRYGDVAEDGSYVLTDISPPYKDITTGQVKGLVTLTSLVDETCKECYNISIHKAILTNFGLEITAEKMYDYASLEGKTLVKKYNITALPTILLSAEAEAYKGLVLAWERVGTVEDDGTYVFRALDVMQGSSYKDLVTGTVKQAEQAKEVSEE